MTTQIKVMDPSIVRPLIKSGAYLKVDCVAYQEPTHYSIRQCESECAASLRVEPEPTLFFCKKKIVVR